MLSGSGALPTPYPSIGGSGTSSGGSGTSTDPVALVPSVPGTVPLPAPPVPVYYNSPVLLDRALRREVASINRALWRRQRHLGWSVKWYTFNPTLTTPDFIYDTGPQRMWNAPRVVPVYDRETVMQQNLFRDTGLYVVDEMALVFSYETLVSFGIHNPIETTNHETDRIEFNGALFQVSQFLPQSPLGADQNFMVVSVRGKAVMPDELLEDAQPWHL